MQIPVPLAFRAPDLIRGLRPTQEAPDQVRGGYSPTQRIVP
jgi:hypothetical protein